MVSATTLDLRYKTHDVLGSLDRGESVIITFRGKPRGLLAPYREVASKKDKTSIMDHPFVGMWSCAATTVEDEMTALRGGRFDDL